MDIIIMENKVFISFRGWTKPWPHFVGIFSPKEPFRFDHLKFWNSIFIGPIWSINSCSLERIFFFFLITRAWFYSIRTFQLKKDFKMAWLVQKLQKLLRISGFFVFCCIMEGLLPTGLPKIVSSPPWGGNAVITNTLWFVI